MSYTAVHTGGKRGEGGRVCFAHLERDQHDDTRKKCQELTPLEHPQILLAQLIHHYLHGLITQSLTDRLVIRLSPVDHMSPCPSQYTHM